MRLSSITTLHILVLLWWLNPVQSLGRPYTRKFTNSKTIASDWLKIRASIKWSYAKICYAHYTLRRIRTYARILYMRKLRIIRIIPHFRHKHDHPCFAHMTLYTMCIAHCAMCSVQFAVCNECGECTNYTAVCSSRASVYRIILISS